MHYLRVGLILISCTVLNSNSPIARGAYLLVAGKTSNNVVRFDVDTGAADVYATFSIPSSARDLELDENGQLYSSTSQGHQNVVTFVPQGRFGMLSSIDFTPDIDGFGPGQIQFYNGDLYAAGDASRAIIQYHGDTGAEIRRFSVTQSFNIRGMTIADDKLYYAEIFQERIRRMDLTQSPPTGGTFITDTTNLNEPMDMIVGGNGNLFVTNRASTLIQEYDIDTGAFVGTFSNLQSFNAAAVPGDTGIAFDPALNNYLFASGNSVYRVSAAGTLLQTYQSPFLSGAYGLVVVPVPEPSALFAAISALISLVIVRRR